MFGFWPDDEDQSDDDSDASEEADKEVSLKPKKAPKSLKVSSKRGQVDPIPATRKKRRPHVEVNEFYRRIWLNDANFVRWSWDRYVRSLRLWNSFLLRLFILPYLLVLIDILVYLLWQIEYEEERDMQTADFWFLIICHLSCARNALDLDTVRRSWHGLRFRVIQNEGIQEIFGAGSKVVHTWSDVCLTCFYWAV